LISLGSGALGLESERAGGSEHASLQEDSFGSRRKSKANTLQILKLSSFVALRKSFVDWV
jgi:hypothetical protein